MKSTAIRVFVVSGIVLMAFAISYILQAATEPPAVEKPNWTLRELPYQFGPWHGEDTEMDPKIAVATGADAIVNRVYRDEREHAVSVHTAMFLNPVEGIYHSPLNCYRASGWTKLTEARENVKVAEDLSIAVSLTTWEKEGEKIQVVYWFQLGQHILYDRFDLGTNVRWSMRGQATWPVLVKVMIQLPLTDPDDAKAAGLGFAQQFAGWLNQPEHRKYLDRWGGI